VIKGVVFDRDGTLIEYVPYLHRTSDVRFYPGVLTACQQLKQRGVLLFIATNQSGIGRGYFSMDDYMTVEAHVETELEGHGAAIEKTYFSPYHPHHGVGKYKQETACRKPNPGMIQQLLAEYSFTPADIIMVGDSIVDIECAQHAGIGSALVRTGLGMVTETTATPNYVGDTIADIVTHYILPQC
jgi:D-glycero-D-manno-heptose 1,7-bisphosphate phosphatase